MSPRNAAALILATLTLTGTSAFAQEGAEPRPAAQDLVRRSTSLVEQDGAILGGGPDYEARFSPGGLDYVPALGRLAPEPQQLSLRLFEVRRGDVALWQAAGDAAAPVVHDDHVTYAHAPWLGERHDVRPEGIELSLCFAAPIAGEGDLVARFRVGTALQPGPRPDDGDGLLFVLPDVGGVGIGGVTGIDAAGRRAAGGLRLDGDVLELSLPGAFVAQAAFPLVLDPLIGTQFLVETSGYDDKTPDAAYDLATDSYLVVFRRVFSATTSAIRGQRVSASGTPIGGFVTVTSGAYHALAPTVANVRTTGRFVVAWQQSSSTTTPTNIHCCTVNPVNGAVSSPLNVTINAGSGYADPDLAGDNSTGDNKALLVYASNNGGILARRITVPASGAPTTTTTATAITTSAGVQQPKISASPPTTSRHVIVWKYSTLGGQDQIRVRACNRNLALLGSELTVATSSSMLQDDFDAPAVDGDGTSFLVAWARDHWVLQHSKNVRVQPLRWNGTALTTVGAAINVDNTSGHYFTAPAVAWCGNRFAILYVAERIATSDLDVRGVELGAACEPCGLPFTLTGIDPTPLRNHESMPAIASERAGGASSNEGLIVFAEADDTAPFASSVIGVRYTSMGTGGFLVYPGPGCGNAGTIGTGGTPFTTGNLGFRLTLSGMPAGGLPIVLIGFPGLETFCGPCIYVQPVASAFVMPAGSTASYAWPLPCSAGAFVGTALQAQWAVLQSGSTPCTAFPGVSFSNRLRITVSF